MKPCSKAFATLTLPPGQLQLHRELSLAVNADNHSFFSLLLSTFLYPMCLQESQVLSCLPVDKGGCHSGSI